MFWKSAFTAAGSVPIFPGVQIIGTRSSNDRGPRLFTTTFGPLFTIGDHFEGTEERHPADNVRISGIELAGADPDFYDGDTGAKAITIASSINVEIDNNEIWGWRTAAIDVSDERGRINRFNGKGAVRIHDNFIHHNLVQRFRRGHGLSDVAEPPGLGHGTGMADSGRLGLQSGWQIRHPLAAHRRARVDLVDERRIERRRTTLLIPRHDVAHEGLLPVD